MINGYDIAYGLGVSLSAPFWLARPSTRKKVLDAFARRMGRLPDPLQRRDLSKPAVMIHAVSLGEINAVRSLIDALRVARPGLQFVVSSTTETGSARAEELYGSAADVTLVRYPLDFSSAVNRLLDGLRPSLVVLMELEVWPNFVLRCHQRGIPIVLVNGRLTTHSFGRYKLIRPFTAMMFRRLARICVQDATYAERFIALGAPPAGVQITGTMKFDTAAVVDDVPGAGDLAQAVGLSPGAERIWVCGSTGPGEEPIVLDQYRALRARFPDLRLVIVPRKPERFDEVAATIASAGFPLVRRSQPNEFLPPDAVILGDTMGELRKFYALADVVFVGRTLADLGPRQHGSDMIEPAALGKPVVVGPYTGNFAEVMRAFSGADAMKVIDSGPALGAAIGALLEDPQGSKAIGARAREVVVAGKGATARHVQIILDEFDRASFPVSRYSGRGLG